MGLLDCKGLVHCTERFEHSLALTFEKWGNFVGRRPCVVIICAFIIAVCLSVGIINVTTETESSNLYVPQNLWIYKVSQKYDRTWGKRDIFPKRSRFIVSHKQNNFKNINKYNYLYNLTKIHNIITNITFKHKGQEFRFSDICAFNDGNNCKIRSILQFYDFNIPINSTNSTFVLKDITYPQAFSSYSLTYEAMPRIVGAPVNLTNGLYLSTTPALFSWYSCDDETYGDRMVKKFEEKFEKLMDKLSKNNEYNFDVSYRTSGSISTELARTIASDIINFIMAFILIGVFSCIVLFRLKRNNNKNNKYCKYKIDTIHNRAPLAVMGIFSSVLAVTTSFGLVGGIFGVKFNSIVSISPFLLVGLGVDDMFVLLRAYDLTPKHLSIEKRMGITMKRGGISILFTSITDLLAFCIGSTSPFNAVKAFCLYTGFGIFLDFLFQISFFLGFMVYHSRQQNIGNYNIKYICCPNNNVNKQYKFYQHDLTVNDKQSNPDEIKVKTMIELQPPNNNNIDTTNNSNNTSEEGEKRRSSFKLKRRQSTIIDSNERSEFMEIYGTLLLKNGYTKGIVFIIEIIFLVFSIIGVSGLKAEQNFKDLVLSDSYLLPYFNDIDKYFSTVGELISWNIEKKYIDYSSLKTYNEISNMSYDIKSLDKCFVPNLGQSWIEEYYNYIHQNGSLDYLIGNETLFNKHLVETFLKKADYLYLKDDLWIENTTQNNYTTYQIKRSRIYIRFVAAGTGTTRISKCLPDMKKIMDKYSKTLNPYPHESSGRLLGASTDLATIPQTIFNLLYATIAAAFFTLFLIPYPLVSIYVMITVAQILLCVLGFMDLWGLPINVTTMICSVMAVGFSVDNSAHFSHSYMITPLQIKKSKYKERLERVLFSLNSVGLPILYGDISTMLAIVPLFLSKSQIFLAFFKVITLVMIFGIWHGLVYLPVLFSIIGPTGNFAKTIKNYNKTKPAIEADEYKMSGKEKHENVCKFCIMICLCKTR